MKFLEWIRSAIRGPGQTLENTSKFSSKIISKHEADLSEIKLVPIESSDPYQDHVHLPHCSDHFLFTKDCALCQESVQARHPRPHPASRSFGFTDNLTTASLTTDLGNFGPTAANVALQSTASMVVQAKAPDRSVLETLAVNAVVSAIVDDVAQLEIDSIRND
jgi:hypothetical protein